MEVISQKAQHRSEEGERQYQHLVKLKREIIRLQDRSDELARLTRARIIRWGTGARIIRWGTSRLTHCPDSSPTIRPAD